MATTTLTQIDPAVNNFYVRDMLKAARPALLHAKFGQIRDIPRGNGLVIKFRRYDLLSVATTALTEGVTPTGSQLSKTDITATVDQYGDFITFTDKLLLTTYDPILAENSELLGQQMGNTVDELTRDVMLAGSTVQYASTATQRTEVTSAMRLTRDEVREAVKTLRGNNAKKLTKMVGPNPNFNTTPIGASYIGIITEDTLHDLSNETGFVPVEEYPSQKDVMENEEGKMGNVRFVLTTNGKVFASGGAGSVDVHGTIILAADYFGITRISGAAMESIVKPLGSGGTSDPLNQRQTHGWKITHVAKRLNENFAVRIEHGVSS